MTDSSSRMPGLRKEVLGKLREAWPIIKWLDDARWNQVASSSSVLPSGVRGPVFDSMDAGGQLLTHWLCYIMDQQRPFEQVWNYASPVVAEIVEEYLSRARQTQDVLDILIAFTECKGHGHPDEFSARKQTFQGEPIRFMPRFGAHLVSIARTLGLLIRYDKDLACYLSSNASFWLGVTGEDDSSIRRMAYLLYIIAYDDMHNGMLSFHRETSSFLKDLQERQAGVKELLSDRNVLEQRYKKWIARRFHKRLWAAFRDYIKPGSYYEKRFVGRLRDVHCVQATALFEGDRNRLLSWLELPGDTWNLQFSGMLFDGQIKHPRHLRQFYESLRMRGDLSGAYYPEQFDVSFDFSPRMCDGGNDRICPFRKDTKLQSYCHHAQVGKDALCPATMVLCGYTTKCQPQGCPIAGAAARDLCSGCAYVRDKVCQ